MEAKCTLITFFECATEVQKKVEQSFISKVFERIGHDDTIND